MSKIGKKPIDIPSGVTVSIGDGNNVVIKGTKGELKYKFHRDINIEMKESKVFLSPKRETKKIRAIWGLSRALFANMVTGVEKGYSEQLELQGVGFRASIKGRDLELNIGFSHPVIFKSPEGIDLKVEKNIITVSGIDKQMVGQVAADIRSLKKPEPYKGKGIRYVGEQVRKKVGKKVAGASGE